VDPDVGFLACALLLLSLPVVLLLHSGVSKIGIRILGLLIGLLSWFMLLSLIDGYHNHLIVLDACFEDVVESKDLALFRDLYQIQAGLSEVEL
jgi:hypothetical protein